MALLCMAIDDLGVAGRVVHRQPGRHRHRHRPRPGEDPRGAGRPRARGARGAPGARRRRLPGRVDRRATSPRSAAAAPTPRRWPWPRRSAPSACEIYTDVTGVFTADPRIVPTARRLARVSFEEMLEMAATGGRVLALRSVEFARNHDVPLHVRSSFTWEPGTWITEEAPTSAGGRHGAGDHLGRHPRHVRGQGDDHRRARPPGHRGPAVPGARRSVDQRRHDRAERLRGWPRPTSPSPRPRPICPSASRSRGPSPTSSGQAT